MKGRSFFLKAFSAYDPFPDIKIESTIERRSNILLINYELIGPLEDLSIPAPADMPLRKDRLWEESCFEFFINPQQSEQYWEFNLSPAGHWNVYHFSSYRQEMREETVFTSLPFKVLTGQNVLRLSLEFYLGRIVPADQALRMAVSAVLKTKRGSTTYWALAHPGPQPDFHNINSFIAEL